MGYYSRSCCSSYTVRCYDADGETVWKRDFFKGSTQAGVLADPNTSLVVAVVGGYVFVAGPRVESEASPGTFWNCVKYELDTGVLDSRHDLWVSGESYTASLNGDIQDICAGDDGNLGVLFKVGVFIGSASQLFASYAPADLSTNWTQKMTSFSVVNPPFRCCELDSSGVMHVGGEPMGSPGPSRAAFQIDGGFEYVVGGLVDFGGGFFWYTEVGYVAKVHAPTSLGLYVTYGATGAWPTHITEAFRATPGYSHVWHSLSTRWNGLHFTSIGGGLDPGGSPVGGLDSANLLSGIGIMRDGSGVATGLVTIGAGHVRGSVATQELYVPPQSPQGVLGTSGSIADSGCVGRWDLSGTFTKAYSPDSRTSFERVATINGAGYYLGAAISVSRPTIYKRDASDAHVWAHRHQSLTDVAVTPYGGCVTVGQRSSAGLDEAFVTP